MTKIDGLLARGGESATLYRKSGATDKLLDSCMQWGIRSSLFCILVVQDFQKFSKSLKPLCRPFRQAPAVGKQRCDFGFLNRQIQATRMLVHAVICVWFFPDHRRHSRHYSLHLVRVGDGFLGGALRVFCCFVHIYTRERYWVFSLVIVVRRVPVRLPAV